MPVKSFIRGGKGNRGDMMGKTYFVTGTDTEIGKTLVTASMIKALRQKAIKAGGYKPLQSGVEDWGSSDAGILYSVSGYTSHQPLTYSFQEAVAPAFAIEKNRQEIDIQGIYDQIDQLSKSLDIVFIEGAGGWLVPFFPEHLVADWARELAVPVIVVGRATLGTINHTLLTVESIQSRNLHVAAILLSGAEPHQWELAIANQGYLKKKLKDIPVFLLPWIKGNTLHDKIKQLSEHREIQMAVNYLYS